MLTRDLFSETYSAITVNKVRSGLTILGIVIGIGSVIGMVAIGQGAQNSVQSSIQSIGSNLLTISPGQQRGVGTQVRSGFGSAQTLTLADADTIRTLPAVKAVAEESNGRYQVTSKGNNTNTQVVGTIPEYLAIHNVEVDTGSFFSPEQVKNANKVAILGPTTRDAIFGTNGEAVGQKIRINNNEFTVIGITKTKGGTGFGNQDDRVFVPLNTAQRFLSGSTYVTSISVQATDAAAMGQLQQDITDLLLQRHKIADPTQADFNVFNQADIVSAASNVTSIFTYLLAAIASISLLVGGIGIMNMMLTTVTERTKEIGLRKAIGAKSKDISLQFLGESIMLTLVGGLLGIALGWCIALLVSKLAGIAASVSLTSVVLACAVSAGIGIVFGYYPARRAAKLNPIEALRYE